MQLHTMIPKTKHRRSRRVGRGGKRGTYSGRGIKGQHARAGAKFRPAEREIIKKIPKLRGYKFKRFRKKPAVVNLDQIERSAKIGDTVTPAWLAERGLVERAGGSLPAVKILGRGTLAKRIAFKGVEFSASAKKKTA